MIDTFNDSLPGTPSSRCKWSAGLQQCIKPALAGKSYCQPHLDFYRGSTEKGLSGIRDAMETAKAAMRKETGTKSLKQGPDDDVIMESNVKSWTVTTLCKTHDCLERNCPPKQTLHTIVPLTLLSEAEAREHYWKDGFSKLSGKLAERQEMLDGIDEAIYEIGVPTEKYPQNIRNVYRILSNLTEKYGGMAERFKAPVSKTDGPEGSAGSNPAPSANFRRKNDRGKTQ